MNIFLTPQLEDFVEQQVASGLYASTSDVMQEALRLMQEQDALKSLKTSLLQQEIQQGIEQLDQGLGKSFNINAIKQAARNR